MAIKRYLALDSSNDMTEQIPITTSTGPSDGGKVVATLESTGRFDLTVMPAEIAPEVVDAVASEALAAGDFVNLWSDAGVLSARKADASGGVGKKADGYTLDAVLDEGTARVYKNGINDQRSGLTVGVEYYLSNTVPGGLLAKGSAPTTATHILQRIGIAKSATEIFVEIENPIIRA